MSGEEARRADEVLPIAKQMQEFLPWVCWVEVLEEIYGLTTEQINRLFNSL